MRSQAAPPHPTPSHPTHPLSLTFSTYYHPP
jgi:hypothetical protein